MTTPANAIKTESLDCAAYLRARGHKLLSADKGQGALTVFTFPAEAAQDLADFYGDALISARVMGQSLRAMKRLLHHTNTYNPSPPSPAERA
jgi:hypothetical protein